MKLKAFFSKNWQHFAAIAFFVIIAIAFYQPQLDGMRLKQHDIQSWKGMAHEVQKHRAETGEEALWTNSMFGGMPAAQISVYYPGSILAKMKVWYDTAFPGAKGLLLIHMLGFYIFALFMRIKPVIGAIGAIAFSFSCYEILIVQAGHTTKAFATAWMAPALGAFIYAYRNHRIWGILFLTLFMGILVMANHFQIVYYFIFLLIAVGVYFLIRAYKKKEMKPFFITSGGLILGILFAVVMNLGNVLLTADYAKYTIRGENDLTIAANGSKSTSEAVGLDRDYITNWSYGLDESFNMLSPNVMGGGSSPLELSHLKSFVENSDFNSSEKKNLMNMSPYWGEQPGTGGPTYLGIVAVLLAFLAMFFMKSKMKWALFAITILAVLLSWGKNFMGLTDFFIDYVPGYNRFRTVTMILVLAELCVAVLGVFFLTELIKNRDQFKEKKNMVAIAIGGFFLFMVIVKFVGIGNYSSGNDQRQLDKISDDITAQVKGADPQIIMSNYNVNVNDPLQLEQFVQTQMEPYEQRFSNLRSIREDVFHSSMNRSLVFIFFAGAFLLAFLYTSIPAIAMSLGVLLLTMLDLIPVANDYIGAERLWGNGEQMAYPISAHSADREIMDAEVQENPELKALIDEAAKKGEAKVIEEEIEDRLAKRNVVDSYRFSALNRATNYRIFDFTEGFNVSRSAYFHKNIGGYHAAKLRNIANVIDFHLVQMNERVYDMFNVKYFIQQTQEGGVVAVPRPTAMGNAWFIKNIESYDTPDDEIRALGNKIEINNGSTGSLLINGSPTNKSIIYGAEKVQYLIASQDTMDVRIPSGMREGEEASFVMDANGMTNLVPKFTLDNDTLNSFSSLISFKVLNEFKPTTEAVMLKSEVAKLSSKEFTGEGVIKMESYAPNKITYTANVKSKQFAVFSEIYYPDGWTAFIDDKEVTIRKANYLLRGLEIPKGSHKIRFEFDQPKYHFWNSMSFVLGLILILSFAGYGFLYWKKNQSQETIVKE